MTGGSGSSSALLAPSTESFGARTPVRADNIGLRRRVEPNLVCTIGTAAAQVLAAFDRVIDRRRSEAMLVWPQRPDGVAVFHALAALRRVTESDRTGLATVFFPWSRNTGGTQRTLLVDRDQLVKATLPSLNRVVMKGDKDRAFPYLLALHSLKHLLSSGKANKRWKREVELDPGLHHPTLYEITPQVGITNGGLRNYADQFLRRMRRLTWIGEQKDHIEAAGSPLRTPFFLFGIHGDATRQKIWRDAGLDPRHGGRKPDVILLDLTRRARNRLGPRWRQVLTRFLLSLSEIYGLDCPAALAITEDVFVLEALRWDVLKEHDIRRGFARKTKSLPPAMLVLNPSGDPLSQEVVNPGRGGCGPGRRGSSTARASVRRGTR